MKSLYTFSLSCISHHSYSELVPYVKLLPDLIKNSCTINRSWSWSFSYTACINSVKQILFFALIPPKLSKIYSISSKYFRLRQYNFESYFTSSSFTSLKRCLLNFITSLTSLYKIYGGPINIKASQCVLAFFGLGSTLLYLICQFSIFIFPRIVNKYANGKHKMLKIVKTIIESIAIGM